MEDTCIFVAQKGKGLGFNSLVEHMFSLGRALGLIPAKEGGPRREQFNNIVVLSL